MADDMRGRTGDTSTPRESETAATPLNRNLASGLLTEPATPTERITTEKAPEMETATDGQMTEIDTLTAATETASSPHGTNTLSTITMTAIRSRRESPGRNRIVATVRSHTMRESQIVKLYFVD
jgi:hypothetical protein